MKQLEKTLLLAILIFVGFIYAMLRELFLQIEAILDILLALDLL